MGWVDGMHRGIEDQAFIAVLRVFIWAVFPATTAFGNLAADR